MSRFIQYDKTSTYLENLSNAKKQRENRIHSEMEQMKKDKIEMDKIKNELEYEEKLEKEKKALMKKKQYEEYMNFMKYKQENMPEERNNLNIKLGGEERSIKKQKYNEQMDNLCLNPTKNENLFPQNQFINFSQAGRNYQRGYSHGYNILTGEIFQNQNKYREKEILNENLKPEHGYNKNSKIFKYLIQYMTGLDKNEQKKFLIFTTGASRLPLGGFKALSPKLTVVKRTMNGNENPNEFLPTVMTCQNYLKIPEYFSFEILKKKFNLAMNEGSNEFHLS